MKLKFYPKELRPTHIIYHCGNKKWPNAPISNLWSHLKEQIIDLRKSFDIKTSAGIMMSNHLHLLAYLKSKDHIFLIQELLKKLQLYSLCSKGKVHPNAQFGWSFFYKIENTYQYRQIYKYILRNPIEAGLSPQVELYPYSSIYEIFDPKQSLCPFIDDMNLITDPIKTIKWLNQPLENNHLQRKANAKATSY